MTSPGEVGSNHQSPVVMVDALSQGHHHGLSPPCPVTVSVVPLSSCYKNNNNDSIEKRNSRFFTISSLRRKLSPTCTLKWPGCNCVQITCNTSGAYHVQHVMCHLVRRDSSAIKFDRVYIRFSSALYPLIPLAHEGGKEPKYLKKNPNNKLQKMPHTKAQKFKPQPRLKPTL